MGGLSLGAAPRYTGMAAMDMTGDPDMDRQILDARATQDYGINKALTQERIASGELPADFVYGLPQGRPGVLEVGINAEGTKGPGYQQIAYSTPEEYREAYNLKLSTPTPRESWTQQSSGGGLFKVLSLAASVAIPFAAPALAGAIGASTAFGATLGSALTGAALGAGKAAVFGEDIGKGALMGGVSGGIGGYLQGAQAAPASGGGLGFTPPSQPLTMAELVGGTSPAAGTVNIAAGLPGGSLAAAAPTITAGVPLTATNVFGGGAGVGGMNAGLVDTLTQQAAGNLVGAAASGAPLMSIAPGAVNLGAGLAPDIAAALPSPATTVLEPLTTSGVSPAVAGGAAPAATTGGAGASSIDPLGTGFGAATPAVSAATGGGAGAGAAAGGGIGGYLGKVGSSLVGNVTGAFTPDKVADLILRGAGLLAIDQLAGGGDGSSALAGLSAEEQALVTDMRDELAKAQEEDENLFNERLRQAYALIGDVDYFDPEYFGLQSARRAQLQAARAKQAGLRGLTGEERAAEARRYDLETGRSAGTAYDVGYGTGVEARTRARQAGIEALPGSYPSRLSDYSTLSNIYGAGADAAARNALARRQGTADFFAGLFT